MKIKEIKHKMTFEAVYRYHEAYHFKTIVVHYDVESGFCTMWADVMIQALEYGKEEGLALESLRFLFGEVE